MLNKKEKNKNISENQDYNIKKYTKKKNDYFRTTMKANSKKNIKIFNTKKDTTLSINKNNLNSKDSLKLNINFNSIDKENQLNINKLKVNKKYFNGYLATSLDDLDYDDAIKKDKRNFCSFFCEAIKGNQIIVNTFFIEDPLKPREIKIMLFIINILLYLVINGLFFNEDYVSKVYHLENEDKFFAFLPRSINRLTYTIFTSLTINFIVECFEINEKKIKGIFIREKNDIKNIKHEIYLLIKLISKRYLSFIIVSFSLFIISFYYLLCFNYVYPHSQIEWVKSSIIIIIIIQIISVLSSLLETILRFLSFLFKSEKIYKMSKLLK